LKKTPKETDSKLKQQKFLDEYSNTLDIKGSAFAAGYQKRTASANARNILRSEKTVKALKDLCERKAGHLEICKGFIINAYLKVLDWALSLDGEGRPAEPALALRALDGITKQLENRFTGNSIAGISAQKQSGEGTNSENKPIISEIAGLDASKI